jgi:hypothetical protein
MNEATPLGSEYNKPIAVVLKGPTAGLYIFLQLAMSLKHKIYFTSEYEI